MSDSGQAIYREKQTFSRRWFVILFLIIGVLQYIKFQNEGFDKTGFFISTSVVVGLAILFVFSKLETVIMQDEIQYRLFPFQLRMRKILKEEIESVFVRKYSPVLEYGGWGLRWGFNGKAINIRGNMGIQVVLKNGSRILIGTSNPEDAKSALEKFIALPTA